MPVYFDNNATTPLDPRVLEAMMPYLQGIYGNPSSVHRYGRLTSGAIEKARQQVAALVNADSAQIIFTSGGTEANNLAIFGVTAGMQPGHMAISAIEHPSIIEPVLSLRSKGWQVDELPVDGNGLLKVNEIAGFLKADTRLVSVMGANNETGAIQPVAEVAQQLVNTKALLHTDASQAAGKIAVDFNVAGVQLMTLSSHKLYGPMGAGALIADKQVSLEPVQYGGSHESGLRSGTPNVAAIVGFGAAAELAKLELQQRAQHMQQLRERLEARLCDIPEVCVFAAHAARLPNTVQFGVHGCHGETLLLQLDRQGFAVSSGSACHSDVNEASHVLVAMKIEPELALTAVRVSLGKDTKQQDVDRFADSLSKIVAEFRQSSVRAANV